MHCQSVAKYTQIINSRINRKSGEKKTVFFSKESETIVEEIVFLFISI